MQREKEFWLNCFHFLYCVTAFSTGTLSCITIIFACNIFFVFCLYLYVLLNSVWEITTQEIFSEDPSFALLPNVFSMLDAKRMYDVLVSSFSIFFKNDDSKMLLGQILTVFDSEKTLTKTFYFAPRVSHFLSRVTATLLI